MSLDECVPCTRGQGVYVKPAAAAGRAHHEPAVRRPPPLAREAEEVLREVGRHRVVSEHSGGPRPLRERTVKDVQRGVVHDAVVWVVAVLEEASKGQPHRVAVVVRTHLRVTPRSRAVGMGREDDDGGRMCAASDSGVSRGPTAN